ncbi:MAG: hypothetical protein U0M42_08525 [Acutalibacteraceae bacterium]|nr:hypothetical protein [Acutalibacteraceae bacterium]
MKQKTKGFLLLFTKEELADVDKKAKKLGLNRTAYLRKVIKGLHVEACPTTELLPYLDEILSIKQATREISDKAFKGRDKITGTYPLTEEKDKIFLEKVERLKEIIDSILEIKEGKWYE